MHGAILVLLIVIFLPDALTLNFIEEQPEIHLP